METQVVNPDVIVAALKLTAIRYHYGQIGHVEFTRRNRKLWAQAESSGCADAVKAGLR